MIKKFVGPLSDGFAWVFIAMVLVSGSVATVTLFVMALIAITPHSCDDAMLAPSMNYLATTAITACIVFCLAMMTTLASYWVLGIGKYMAEHKI